MNYNLKKITDNTFYISMPFSKNQSIIFNKEFFKKIFIMKMISKYQNNQEVIQFNTKKKKTNIR